MVEASKGLEEEPSDCAQDQPAAQTPFSNPSQAVRFGGLFERVLLVIAFAWYVILAIRMLMREKEV